MAFKQANRTKQIATTTGTGPFTLGSTPLGLQPFSATYGAGDTFYYVADDGAGNWEIGVGTFTDSTHFARTTLVASSSGGFINFTAVPTVWVDLPSSKVLTVDPSGNVTVTGHITIEGVTTTGATGTGNLVFSNAPAFTGTLTGVNTNFSGTMTAAAVTATGPISGTTGAFSGAVAMGALTATTVNLSGILNSSASLVTTGSVSANGLGTFGNLSVNTTAAIGGVLTVAGISAAGVWSINNSAVFASGAILHADTGSGGSLTVAGFGNSTAYEAGSIINSSQLNVQAGGSGGTQLLSGATAWTPISDEREKDGLEAIDPAQALADVLTWRTMTGYLKNDSAKRQRQFLIAQDIQKNTPEAVFTDEEGVMHLDYDATIPKIVAAIKYLAGR
jgi:hypothetical protein